VIQDPADNKTRDAAASTIGTATTPRSGRPWNSGIVSYQRFSKAGPPSACGDAEHRIHVGQDEPLFRPQSVPDLKVGPTVER